MSGFLPISKQDMKDRGIEQLDFICITGDAYVDHPSFGMAIISRVIESEGFTVGVIAQPNYHSLQDFQKLGKPKYAFLVNSGNVDSMVTHYTVAKRRRHDDAYSPGGKGGYRPDRAVNVYCQKLREAFGEEQPIIIGGLEASLRRFAHYDYWDDAVRPTILLESKADLLVYGMGELQTKEIVHRLANGESIKELTDIRGTCYLTEPVNTPWGAKECPSFDQVVASKESYAKACKIQFLEQDQITGKTVIQRHGNWMLVQNPPMRSLNQKELDRVYALPYMRTYHPVYEPMGGVPAIQEVEFSIAHNRGCFGDCNFCAITLHQGRHVTCRSEKSVLAEAKKLTQLPNFKGYIHDVGGPTADFRKPSCQKQNEHGMCRGKKCLAPTPCKNLEVDHKEYLHMLRELRQLDGVKKVFIRSGIRYDYLIEDPDPTFMRELVEHHVSGQLKVAPEHCSNRVLDCMGKPHVEIYKKFMDRFYQTTKEVGKEQYLVPYLMSSHPGCTLKEAIELAEFLKKEHIRPEQVQDFYPTPGTISTCMFYTGYHPLTMEKVYVPKSSEEKAMQRALLQYFMPKNKPLVLKALRQAKRLDLIGTGPNCLVRPDGPSSNPPKQATKQTKGKRGTKWQKGKTTTKRKTGKRN
ncbi:YgiQ family radical SAM protein [Clostridium facile]|uniref:YgiQ family radical SAM protein n=1 Tax=Clostridium facile TaxID=2763035 RepID=A0ABR7IQ09_9CLOT|nr:YgiQ family radical SAM protein [Clostridium facile]MBC5787208.1 YgiQ family radical SAM protein [Clostridium facile]